MDSKQVLKLEDVNSNGKGERADSAETHENVQRAVEALQSLINYMERREY